MPIPLRQLISGLTLKPSKPRIFTAMTLRTLRTLRSIRQVRISCLPLRSLRLRGENALLFFFRVIPSQMLLLCFSLFPCNSVFIRGKCFFCFSSFPCSSVANASLYPPSLTHPALISRLIPCNSVFVRGKCISFGLFASLFRVNPWQMPFLC